MGRLTSLFGVAVLFAALSGGPLHAQTTDSGSPAPLNPEFVKYLNDTAAHRVRTLSESGHPLGLTPAPVDLSHTQGQQVYGQESVAFPASYDLRTQVPSRLTPIRDQGNCGSCWAFATYGSLESALLPSHAWDFSENNLKNTHGFDIPHNAGGNYSMSTAYLARWSGPINEADDPYNPTSGVSPPGLAPVRHVQKVDYVPNRSGPLDNDNIKWAVRSHGAVSTSLYWSDSYYNPATYAYYYSGSTASNHGVCIVGWDDNYDRTRFTPVPPGNGAFIARNSWGPGFGESGYFYVSYYDSVVGTGNAQFWWAEDTDYLSRVYQYDPLGWCGSWGGWGTNTGWFANVFTAAANEQLSAVSWYVASSSFSYTFYVYLDPGSGPMTGTLVATRSGSYSGAPAYQTLSVVPSVPLTAGHRFSVVVKLTTPGYDYPIPLEAPQAGYSSGATANAGESFISPDGTNWWDFTTLLPSANVCLKAFTKDAAQFGGSYVYWVPYVEQTAVGPSETWNYVYLRAEEDGTSVSVDFNHDGVPDVTSNLSGWDCLLLGGPHNTVAGAVPGLLPGTRITSNKPLVAIYRFAFGDFGAYEDGMLWYSLPTTAVTGNEFWLPFSAQKTALVGTTNGTEVTVDTNGDGVPDQTLTLGYGETEVLTDLPAGSRLSSSQPIGAAAVAYSNGFYDNTYAVTLLPTNLWSTSYFVPLGHPYSYPSATDLSRVLIVGGQDGTSVSVGGQNLPCNRGQVLSVNLTAEAQIQSTAPIYAVYVSDILATDPWKSVQRHYAYAHNLPSDALKVNETTMAFAAQDSNGAPATRVVVTGLSPNTHVALDISANGGVDRTETLNRGQCLYLDERDPSLSGRLLKITADAPFSVVRSLRGWWAGTSETTAAAEDLPVDVTVTNAPPFIVSLSNTPDPVRAGSDLNLSAIGVSDPDGPDTITNVKFYRESNGTPGLQTGAGGDTLVGTDSNSAGGWTATVATTGLVAGYYTYYAQATDNQGAVSNVVSTISTVETGDMALSFDGGDRVIIPNTAALNPPQITVECLVNFGRIGANPDWQFLVSKGGDRTDGSYRLMQASGSGTSNDNFSFGIGPYWNRWSVGTTTPLQINRWYHVASTYDGQTIRLYVDGTLVGSNSVGSIPVGNSSPLYLSYNDVGGFPYFLTGQMDEVRIWNYARTQGQIQSTMNVPLTGSEPGLVGYWDFNEPVDDQTIYDRTANGSNGQLGSTSGVDSDDPTRVPRTPSNHPPVIVSLSDTPDPVRAGSNLSLSAIGVSDPDGAATIANVKFYRESNGTAGLQTGAGGDALVGTDSSGAGGWTTAVAITGLVAGDYTYYAQAADNQGAVSNVVSTISTVQTGLPIGEAKLLPDGSPVETGGAIISASWRDFFYIEADERSSGIRVERSGHGLTKDKRANVTGVIKTNDDGERYIEATDAVEWGSVTAAPLGMANRMVGGGDWRYQETTGAGQEGVKGGFGLMNNIGLLVRVWGRVTASGTVADPRYPITWLYVDDGSKVRDGTGVTGLYCEAASNVPPPSVGSYVCVTGVSSCEFYLGDLVNVLRVTGLEGIPVPPPTETISTPGAPTGEQNPRQNDGPCTYSTTGATCSWGHPVEYSFNWGDGTNSSWSTSTSAWHVWGASGPMTITVTARCQVHPSVSAASSALIVNVQATHL